MASQKPGATMASAPSLTCTSPPARSTAALQASIRPPFDGMRETLAPGASRSTTSAVPSLDQLSATISSSPLASWWSSGGRQRSTSSRSFQVTMITERVRPGTPEDYRRASRASSTATSVRSSNFRAKNAPDAVIRSRSRSRRTSGCGDGLEGHEL
jgi:hypothetical protein